MWKVLLISFLSLAANAERRGVVERMEAEAQDAEECATAPGNPTSIEECGKAKVANAKAFDACLSDNSVKVYEKSAYNAAKEVEQEAKSWHLFEGRNSQVVYGALRKQKLITKELERKGGDLLEENGFVNLLACPDWAKKLKDPKKIPRGAVLTYADESGKTWGDVRMKTPKGCLSSAAPLTDEEQKHIGKGPEASDAYQLLAQKAAEEHVKKASCLDNPGFKLTGIYVKNVN